MANHPNRSRRLPSAEALLAFATPFRASISSVNDGRGTATYRAHVTAHGASEPFFTLRDDEWDGPGSPSEAMRQAERLVEVLTARRESASPYIET